MEKELLNIHIIYRYADGQDTHFDKKSLAIKSNLRSPGSRFDEHQ